MIKLMKKYLKDYKKEVFLGPFFKLVEAVFELLVPIVMAKIIDVGVKNADTAYVFKYGLLIVLLGVVGYLSALVCQYYGSRASQGVGTKMRNDLFKHINSLSYSEIDKFGTPTLITRLTNDINQVQLAVAMLIRLVVRAPFLVIGSTIMAMMIDLKISLIFLITAPVIALIVYTIMKKTIPFFKTIQKKLDKISLITRENLTGIRVIRAFSKQEREEKRFNDAVQDHTFSAIKAGKISALMNPLTYMAVNIAIIFIIWFGALRVDQGHLSQGQIIALVNYMTQILLALIVIANVVVIFTKASASSYRIQEVFDVNSSVVFTNELDLNAENQGKNKVSFENVYFSYSDTENSEYALEDINIEIKENENIGVIGGTGSGKTTFINLIPRFYDCSKGTVYLDGIDIKKYSKKQISKKIGIVPQKAVLFAGTVRENMKWRDENASDEEIFKALEISQSMDFVKSLKGGLDFKIQQGGKNLSGGQRQRLTIARALVGSPEIVILDDSASALDFATDAALRKALKHRISNTTVFLVSQRVNTVKNADRIVVFDDGKIAGIGTHFDLFENCEVYKEICLSQLSRDEIEAFARKEVR